MTARILLAAIAAFFISTARADEPKSVGKQLVSAAEAVTTTGPGFSSDGKAQRIVATGISTATVTVYGTNVYCGKTCSASSTGATSVGTITSSGDSVDNQTYLYYFALVTAYTSGTIDVTMTEQPAGGAGSSSSSPAYSVIVTPNGDSAMDDTNDAVRANIVTGTVTATGAMTVEGGAAHDAVEADDPITVGGTANSASSPTAVASGDKVRALFDVYGKQAVSIGRTNGGNGDDMIDPVFLYSQNTQDPGKPLAVANWVLSSQTTNGAAGRFDMERTPDTCKTATATASGNTAVWVPSSSSDKFRLMKYLIEVTNDAAKAAAGVLTIKWQDNTTDMNLSHAVYLPIDSGNTPQVHVTSGYSSGWIDLGNGLISAADNQTLNINLSAAVTEGTVSVIACGIEEN